MKTSKGIDAELKKIKPMLTKKYNVDEIYVFGSYVRGEQKEGSDVDILVDFYKPIGLFEFMRLEFEIEERLGVKVDLVSKKALKPRIGQQILREAIKV